MKMPRNIKLGKTRYVVVEPVEMSMKAIKGNIDFALKWIRVAKQCNVSKRKYSEKERAETFWHEVTHGILFDMGDPRAFDEKFVTAFSRRLNDAIRSAKF